MRSGNAFIINIGKNVCEALEIKEPGWVVEFDMKRLHFRGKNSSRTGKKKETQETAVVEPEVKDVKENKEFSEV